MSPLVARIQFGGSLAPVVEPTEGCTAENTISPSGTAAENRQAIVDAIAELPTTGGQICLAAGDWSFEDTNAFSIIATGKSFVLKGAGIDQTYITDNKASGNGLFSITTSNYFRLSGMTIRHGASGNHMAAVSGFIKVIGGATAVRIDHIKFDQLFGGPNLLYLDDVLGVFDQNVIVYASTTGTGRNISCRSLVGLSTFFGGTRGHGSYARASNWGTSEFWFVENNDFLGPNLPTVGAVGAGDNHFGARTVNRRNYFLNCNLATHGTESGNNRGARAMEVYQNQWERDAGVTDRYSIFRAGTGLVWGNDVTSATGDTMVQGYAYLRLGNLGDWGVADGATTRVTHPWGATGTLQDSGTVESGGAAPLAAHELVTDTSKSWTPSTGTPDTADCSATSGGFGGCLYTVKVFTTPATTATPATGATGTGTFVMTASAPTFLAEHLRRYVYVQGGVNAGAWGFIQAFTDSTHVTVNVVKAWTNLTAATAGQWVIMFGAMIRYNTATQLIYADGDLNDGDIWHALAGESYEIWGPFGTAHALDEPGMGQSDLLVGAPNNVTPYALANQAVEQIHIWGNRQRDSAGDATWATWNNATGSQHLHATAFDFTALGGYTPYTWPHPLRTTGAVSGDNDGGEVGTDGTLFP